ncbi:MAG: retroviral-like aspartic protease family protein [Bacteroidetes bacterium]|nr:retroviral-like aspartic protease family protein [Bacteroidota bacterium]
MPSLTGNLVNGEILFDTWVFPTTRIHHSVQRQQDYIALLDTGAQRSMISNKIVSQLGLQSVGYSSLVGVTGKTFQASRFRVHIEIQIFNSVGQVDSRGRDLEAALLPYSPYSHDVILGMDFISLLHLTVHDGSFILSI